jgi:hypothetical protein
MKEKIKNLVKGVTLKDIIYFISVAFLLFFWVENRYALAKDMKAIQQTVSCISMNDEYKSIRDRIWAIETKYGENVCDNPNISNNDKLEYKELIEDKAQLKELLKGCGRIK